MRHIAIHDEGQVELALATADRREWRVMIDLRTLSQLDGGPVRSDDDVGNMLIRHMAALKLAALRVIGRGRIDGDMVWLDASDLRLPADLAA